jgi:hypothetical protein
MILLLNGAYEVYVANATARRNEKVRFSVSSGGSVSKIWCQVVDFLQVHFEGAGSSKS